MEDEVIENAEIIEPSNEPDETPEPEPKPEVKPEAKAEAKPEAKIERQVFSMPVAKAQEEKRKAVEKARQEAEESHNAKLEALKSEYEAKLRKSEPADALDQVADKHGLDRTAARELADAIRQTIKVPDTSKYDQILKDREIESFKHQVSQDFDAKVAPMILKENPQATPEYLRKVKAHIEELAFTEGYNTYRLEDIWRVKKDEMPYKNGLSAETPGGRGTDLVSFKKLSDEDEIALADRDQGTYVKYLQWLRNNESQYLN